MATTIDDRQELLEQFQAVSDQPSFSRFPGLALTFQRAFPRRRGSLSIAGLISVLSLWKPTLVERHAGCRRPVAAAPLPRCRCQLARLPRTLRLAATFSGSFSVEM